jgi:hypothetical protein
MMSVLPAALAMSIAPVVLNPTTTIVEMVLPASASMFDVPGWPVPSGQSVKNVVEFAFTTVRLSTMAVAPAGMPLNPVTCQISISCEGERCSAVFDRLSSARTGVIGVNALCTGPVACAIED